MELLRLEQNNPRAIKRFQAPEMAAGVYEYVSVRRYVFPKSVWN